VIAGHFDVSTAMIDGRAAISVSNTGTVIPADDVERLAQPFAGIGSPAGRLGRRLWPALATACLIVIAMTSAIWFGPGMTHSTAWALPDDLWGTLTAAQRLAHLNLGGLYTQPTGLVSLPGTVVIMLPVVAVIDAAGISLQVPGAQYPHPTAWLLAGPYEIALSAVVLFAADAIAEHMGVARSWRVYLVAAEAVALWSVSARWGHPEDAVAVGLLLYGVLALSRSGPGRAGWLIGAAVAVQPLVLLALPVVAVAVEPRRLPGFLARASAPAALLLAAAAWANWGATWSAVTRQPNSVTVNHSTAWTWLSPNLGGGVVAGGPGRVLAIVAACGCALVAARRLGSARPDLAWDRQVLEDLLWWVAVALALRSVFESVMVSYYLWPVLAVAMVAASTSWHRLVPTSAAAAVVTFASQASWHSLWAWWLPMLAGLGVTLFLARVPIQQLPAWRHGGRAVSGTDRNQAGRTAV
jgi:hypothetical protein